MSVYRRTRTSSRGPPSRQRRAEEDDEGRVEGRMTVNELEPRGSCSRPWRLSSTFLGSHELRHVALTLLSLPLFRSIVIFSFSIHRVLGSGSISRVKPLPAFMSVLDYRERDNQDFPEMYELMTMARWGGRGLKWLTIMNFCPARLYSQEHGCMDHS